MDNCRRSPPSNSFPVTSSRSRREGFAWLICVGLVIEVGTLGVISWADTKFVIATDVSILTLLLATVFGPLQAFLKTTSLDAREWLICLAVALSIVVVSEIRKAVRRHSTPGHQETR
jgi:hypothetical protein